MWSLWTMVRAVRQSCLRESPYILMGTTSHTECESIFLLSDPFHQFCAFHVSVSHSRNHGCRDVKRHPSRPKYCAKSDEEQLGVRGAYISHFAELVCQECLRYRADLYSFKYRRRKNNKGKMQLFVSKISREDIREGLYHTPRF